jgi:hypothetical protein
MKLLCVSIIASLIATFSSADQGQETFIPSADFQLNDKQTEILRSGGTKLNTLKESTNPTLQHQIKDEDLNELATKLKPVYAGYVNSAIGIIANTKEDFYKWVKTPAQQRASEMFFGDISYEYNTVKEQISLMNGPKLATVTGYVSNVLSDSASVLLIAADKSSTGLDLLVDSDPPTAQIFVKRAPDPDFTDTRQTTKDTVVGLSRANWLVRCRLKGYDDAEKWFVGRNDPHDSIFLVLRPSKKKKAP